MKEQTVNVKASKNYTVTIGSGLIIRAGELVLKHHNPCKAAIITDSTVEKLYLRRIETSLTTAGFSTCCFSFPAGELSKNIRTLSDILEFLAENHVTRSDIMIALGGGVVGDTAGFAAGCYLRGIPFVQIPTTLLAAVDSSVGGKTAVDLAAGKNLAGLFNQPLAVICDTDTLKTLPEKVFSDGLAETIKYGILCDRELFDTFRSGTPENMQPIIKRCVEIKAEIVENDEFDTGKRQLLNLGHTIGHAVEKCSGLTVSHGSAVAIGTAMIAKAAEQLGICSDSCSSDIISVLEKNGLPTRTDYPPEDLCNACLGDKKRSGGFINLVIPRKIGECVLKRIPVSELITYIRASKGQKGDAV